MSNLKNLLYIHIDTTGLPKRVDDSYTKPNKLKHNNFKNNEAYEDCRLVRLSWIFNDEKKDFIRKPKKIKIVNEKYHGISHKYAYEKGTSITKIFQEFINDLHKADYVIGHNIYFHLNIILNELYRKNWDNISKMVEKFIDENKVICTGEVGKTITQIKIRGDNKMPRLDELYKKLFNKLPKNTIGSNFSVEYVSKIFLKIIKNIDRKLIVTEEASLISEENFNNIKKTVEKYDNEKELNEESENMYLLRISKETESYADYKILLELLQNLNIEVIDWSFELEFKLKLLVIVESDTKLKIKSPDFYNIETIKLDSGKGIRKAHNYIHKQIETSLDLQNILIKNMSNSDKQIF
ncbi:MAG: hypothetical protein CMF62_03300 [Magnetococcales bacterium]|nr:hypothetical protein [Magnetococcales bacterium]|tara:strand:- start:19 stop:1074 length:1056 start_codon:yes stop_codon:yes gene_type:complete